MSEVKRYGIHFAVAHMLKEDSTGCYVLASDYAALEAECVKLREALRECLEAMELSKLTGRVYVSGREVIGPAK